MIKSHSHLKGRMFKSLSSLRLIAPIERTCVAALSCGDYYKHPPQHSIDPMAQRVLDSTCAHPASST
ncbi:hypothetical protein XACM_0819 [Xanthomonas euvesicatoria pv. citrumelo F1]|nr:hypothetical protein XACM_0819 [Xanthomonas euvesicatoria pv. citrumelo F1]